MRLAIIGRGIAALAAADQAGRNGFEVSIFAPPRGNGDASFAAHGFSIHKGLLLPDSPLFQAKLAGQARLWHWLNEIERASGTQLRRTKGVFEPYWTAEDYRKIAGRVYRTDFIGCCRVRHGPAKEPWADYFSTKPLGTLYYPDDFWFDPREFLDVLEMVLLARNTKVVSVGVVSIRRESQAWTIVTYLGEQLPGYDAVIIAAGKGVNEILMQSGMPSLRLKEVPGAVIERPHHASSGPLAMTCFGAGALIGAHSRLPIVERAENADTEFNSATTYFHLRPQFFGDPALRVHGIRIRVKDNAPVLGRMPGCPDTLFLFTGLSRNGMELASGCAAFLMNLIKGSAIPPNDPHLSFSPARLAAV